VEIKLSNDEIRALLGIRSPEFPRYVTQILNLANQNEKIDRDMVHLWVKDLVINKTFMGLRLQDAILKRLAREFGVGYRQATPKEES